MDERIGFVALAALMTACGGCDGSSEAVDMALPDLPRDEGMPDEGMRDDGPETDPLPVCAGLGISCEAAMGCRVGTCQPALPQRDRGSDADPIRDLPGGGTSYAGPVIFDDGFCTLDTPFEDDVDCREVEGLCGDCMSCVTAFGEGACYLDCDPRAPGNDVCPDAWDCVPLNNGGGICFDGCARDTDCFGAAVIREETNGIEGIQTLEDCEAVPSPCGFAGPDELVFIAAANPTCDLDTFECQIVGDPTAEPGDGCRGDFDCPDDGVCRNEPPFDDGYCFGPECTSDADCGGDSVCGGGRSGAFLTAGTDRCLVGCDLTVGVEAANVASWPAGRGGCDEGFKCLSDASADSPELGVCVPDAIDPFSAGPTFTQAFGAGPNAPNLGAACTSSDECFNPFGYGTCLIGLNGRDGFCTVEEAGVLEALGFEVCAGETIVVTTSGPPSNEQSCLPTCTTGDDCPTGFGCVSAGTENVCFPTGCEDDGDCRSDEECIAGGCFDTCREGGACGDGLGCLPLNRIFNVMNTDPVCFDVCLADAECSGGQVCAGETADTFGRCITACADATECAPGQACVDFDGATGGERECRATCALDGDCREGERCDAGACMPS